MPEQRTPKSGDSSGRPSGLVEDETDADRTVPEAVRIAVWALVMVGFAIRIYGNWWDYPLVLHPDEPKIVGRAVMFIEQKTLLTRFLHYPTLYIYVHALVFGLIDSANSILGFWTTAAESLKETYAANGAIFHIIGRVLTACFGAASIGLVWKIGRRLFGWRAGIAAAGFMAVAYRHVLDSHFATTDVPAAFFVLVAIYLSLPIFEGQARRRDYVLAGLVAGLAAATKYPAGLVLIVPLAAHFLLSPSAGEKQPSWSAAALCIGWAVAGFVAGCPSAVRLWDHFGLALLAESIHAQTGHLGIRPGTFFGYFTQLKPAGGVGWMMVIAAICGLAGGFLKAPRKLAFVCAFPIIYYLLLGSRNLQMTRYVVMLAPFFALWAGAAIWWLHTELLAPRGHRFGWMLLALMVAAPGLVASASIGTRALAQENTYLQTSRWVRQHIAAEEKILLFGADKIRLSADRTVAVQETYNDMFVLRYRVVIRWLKALEDSPLGRWKAGWFRDKIAATEQLAAQFETIAESRAPAYEKLVDESCGWAVIRSRWRNEFYQPWAVRKYPEMTASWQELIERVETEGTPVFDSAPGSPPHPWGLGFMRNPTLVVYRLDEDTGTMPDTVSSCPVRSDRCIARPNWYRHNQPPSGR